MLLIKVLLIKEKACYHIDDFKSPTRVFLMGINYTFFFIRTGKLRMKFGVLIISPI